MDKGRGVSLAEDIAGRFPVISGAVGWANAIRGVRWVRGLDAPTAWRQSYLPKACRMVFRMKRKSRDDRASPIIAT